MMMYRVAQLSKKDFVERYGDVFENSSWLAVKVWDSNLDQQATAQGLHEAFEHFIERLSPEDQLALLNGHPDLAVATKGKPELSETSELEQRRAGLNRCTPQEIQEFQDLNSRYREKFGFPFIMAVRNFAPEEILDSFRARLGNSREEEFKTALEQVLLIGKYRIFDRFEEPR